MSTFGYTLFDTAIGCCGLAWGPRGIVAVQLPEKDRAATRRRLLRRAPNAVEGSPPPDMRRAIDGIVALLRGEPVDLTDIGLDMDGVPPLNRRVYEAARAIKPGETLTYGAIAKLIGEPGAARAVGQALGHNPFAPIVPCHRVLAAGGRTGGFSANGGVATKLRMLRIEGAQVGGGPTLFDDDPAFNLGCTAAAAPRQ